MWDFIFLMFVMKIPIVYLCLVVWWAVKAEPRPLEGAALPAEAPDGGPGWTRRAHGSRPRRRGPHGSPARRYARPGRASLARAEVDR
jgi:hypothetical protein